MTKSSWLKNIYEQKLKPSLVWKLMWIFLCPGYDDYWWKEYSYYCLADKVHIRIIMKKLLKMKQINEKIIKLCDLNELAYEDLILLTNSSSSVGKVTFGLVCHEKSLELSKGNCKLAWSRLLKVNLKVISITVNLTQFRKIQISGSWIWNGCTRQHEWDGLWITFWLFSWWVWYNIGQIKVQSQIIWGPCANIWGALQNIKS